jgi:hypothetical protein
MKRIRTQDIPIECWAFAVEWLTYDDASSFRLASTIMRDVVKRSVLDDMDTTVFQTDKWLTCFPSAISLKVRSENFLSTFPMNRLTHLHNFEVEYDGNDNVGNDNFQIDTDTFHAFKFHTLQLDFSELYKDDQNLTSACFGSLSGIEHLDLTGLGSIAITDSFFEPLVGIRYLNLCYARIEITDKALDFIKGVEILVLEGDGQLQITPYGILSLSGIKQIFLTNHGVKVSDVTFGAD